MPHSHTHTHTHTSSHGNLQQDGVRRIQGKSNTYIALSVPSVSHFILLHTTQSSLGVITTFAGSAVLIVIFLLQSNFYNTYCVSTKLNSSTTESFTIIGMLSV